MIHIHIFHKIGNWIKTDYAYAYKRCRCGQLKEYQCISAWETPTRSGKV